LDLSVLDGLKSMWTNDPFNLEFAVTRNCNSRCLMCEQWKRQWENELNIDEISRIFKSYRGWKIVGITGGEPTLREDLSEILKVIALNQPNLKRIFVTSNGFRPGNLFFDCQDFLKWYSHDFKEARKDFIFTCLVSIDGPKKLHNLIRGRDFAYDKAVESLRNISELRDQYSRTFRIGSVSTYGPFNYLVYDEVLQELKELHERFDTEPAFCFVWFGNLYDHLESQVIDLGYLEAIKEDRFKIIKFIKNCNGSRVLDGRSLFWLFSSRFAKDPGKQIIPCEAAKIRYFLNSNGDVFPCVIWNKKICSMRDQYIHYDFREVLKDLRGKWIHYLIKEKKCPGCYLTCEFIPTMMAHPFITAKLFLEEKLSINR
jgi:MoaA/NifB/PqqE/SkfB family radical SAM enzyme